MPTITAITKRAPATYEWTITATGPVDVYRYGLQVATNSTETTFTFYSTDALEPPALEFVNANTTALIQNVRYSPRATIQWRGDPTLSYYDVQQYSTASSAWASKFQVRESGNGYYKSKTPALADATSHQWRVLGYDAAFNATPEGLPFTFSMTRNPPPPSVQFTYTSSNTSINIASR